MATKQKHEKWYPNYIKQFLIESTQKSVRVCVGECVRVCEHTCVGVC